MPEKTLTSDSDDDGTCDWHPEHGEDDVPKGQRCGAPAAYRIMWLDGSQRFSLACAAHLALDPACPVFRVEALP